MDVAAEARRVLAAPPHDRWAQLGVPPGASAADVKRAFKRLCALHPDKHAGDLLLGQAFATVAAAYQVHRHLPLARSLVLASSCSPP